MTIINGREYEWADIELVLAGVPVTGFRGIKYGPKQEKEALYGKGGKPLAIQNGNKSYEGEITLTQSAAEALRLASKGDLLNIRNASVTITYGDPSKGVAPVTDRLIGISFTENTIDWKQGQKFAEVPLPFLYLDQK